MEVGDWLGPHGRVFSLWEFYFVVCKQLRASMFSLITLIKGPCNGIYFGPKVPK